MEDLIDAIRRIIERWVRTTTHLTADASVGDDTITVFTTSRFSAGDEILIKATNDEGGEDTEFGLIIEEIVDRNTIRLVEPLTFNWAIADDATIIKTIRGLYVRSFHFGEPDLITLQELPAITISGKSRSSEWYTVRATKERFEIEIGVFVVDGSMEDGSRFLLNMCDTITAGLKQNVYPLVNDYTQTVLTAQGNLGDEYIKVADSSLLQCGQILIENEYDSEENTISQIVDATTVKLGARLSRTYTVTNTKVIRPNRLFYNSWPADTQYGKIHKGTLLKAGVISFFAEETEIQGNNTFSGPQIS